MNQMLDRKTPATPARFTAKQGQYLAFIYYYTKIHGLSPAEADSAWQAVGGKRDATGF